MFLTGFGKTTEAKDIRQIHARLKMRSYAAEVFWAVLPRKSFLKLKARSRAPEFAYIHAATTHTHSFTFTFSHLADAFVQSDVQGREQSSYEHLEPWCKNKYYFKIGRASCRERV